jgi:hypothetical protein
LSGIDISSHHWFLLIARPNRVFKAASALQEHGLVTALPYEWRSRRRSRHCKSVRRFPQAHLGSYLITGFPTLTPAWRSLFEDPQLEPLLSGVVSVTSDGLPSLVRPTEVFRQHIRYGADLYELPPKSIIDAIDDDHELEAGMLARVGRWHEGWSRGERKFDPGAFVDKVVTISAIDGDMARVLLPMFGGEREARVPVDHLQAA